MMEAGNSLTAKSVSRHSVKSTFEDTHTVIWKRKINATLRRRLYTYDTTKTSDLNQPETVRHCSHCNQKHNTATA